MNALEQGLLERLKDEFDFIVVDSHPVLPATDSLLIGQHADAVIVQPSLPNKRAAALALAARCPSASPIDNFAGDGGLLSYSGRTSDQFRQAAQYVDKILKGARPGDLPIQLPTEFDLKINLRTAKALGLQIPSGILARADEVLE